MDTPQPLSPRARPAPVARLNRKVILPAAALVLGLLAWLIMRGLEAPKPRLVREEAKVQGYAQGMPEFLRTPLPLSPVRSAQASTAPEPSPAAPSVPPEANHHQQPEAPVPPRPARRTIPPPPPLPPPPKATTGDTPRKTPQTPPLPQPTKTPPPRWLFPESRGLVVPAPFPDDPGQIATQGKAQNLIAQASWAQCEERTKCLYETQLIHGQIVQAINSDIPGAVWIKVTNQVTDMFGEGQVLIPQGATLVGAQQGLPKAGDNRLEFLLQRGVFPDGTVLSFAGSRLGDATGAAGLSGAVDNHYWQLGIATILTAALSVGAREVGGTSGGFRATPEEDFAKEIAGSTNTTGREIVRRQLVKGPTITLTQGTPVVVQLKETLSLQTPPTIVRQ